MPELLWNVLAIVGLLCVVCTLLLGVWVSVVGWREGAPLPDEEPTLNVQNGIGDATWQPLDPVTAEEAAADLRQLQEIDPRHLYAINVALPSGRSWRYRGRIGGLS